MVVNLQGIANTTSNTQQTKDIVIYQQLQKRSEAKFARLSLISPMQRAGFRDFLLSYNVLLSIKIPQCMFSNVTTKYHIWFFVILVCMVTYPESRQ